MSPNLIHTSSLNRIYLVPILLVYPLRAGPVCVCVFLKLLGPVTPVLVTPRGYTV